MGRWAYTASLVSLLTASTLHAQNWQVQQPDGARELKGRTAAALINATTVAAIAKWRGQDFAPAFKKALLVTTTLEVERHLENKFTTVGGPLPTGRLVDQVGNSMLANIASGKKLCSNIQAHYLQVKATYNCGALKSELDTRTFVELGAHIVLGAHFDWQTTALTGVPTVTYKKGYLPAATAKFFGGPELPAGMASGHVMAIYTMNDDATVRRYRNLVRSNAKGEELENSKRAYRAVRMQRYETVAHERRHLAQHDYIDKLTNVAQQHLHTQGKDAQSLRMQLNVFGIQASISRVEALALGANALLPYNIRFYEQLAHNEQVRTTP